MAEREIWIDQAYAASAYRIRERVGLEVQTLGSYATRAHAELALDQLLHPEKYADGNGDGTPAAASEAPPKKQRSWTKGISPADR